MGAEQINNCVTVQHPGHSGRFASFVVGGQSRFAPCPPTKYESNPVSEQVPCLGFTHISWVLNRSYFMGAEQIYTLYTTYPARASAHPSWAGNLPRADAPGLVLFLITLQAGQKKVTITDVYLPDCSRETSDARMEVRHAASYMPRSVTCRLCAAVSYRDGIFHGGG